MRLAVGQSFQPIFADHDKGHQVEGEVCQDELLFPRHQRECLWEEIQERTSVVVGNRSATASTRNCCCDWWDAGLDVRIRRCGRGLRFRSPCCCCFRVHCRMKPYLAESLSVQVTTVILRAVRLNFGRGPRVENAGHARDGCPQRQRSAGLSLHCNHEVWC